MSVMCIVWGGGSDLDTDHSLVSVFFKSGILELEKHPGLSFSWDSHL